MSFTLQYRAARALSPKAARFAVRLLDGTAGIPLEWRLPLRMVLAQRSLQADGFTTSDFVFLAEARQVGLDRDRPPEEAGEHADAHRFVRSLRQAARRRFAEPGDKPF